MNVFQIILFVVYVTAIGIYFSTLYIDVREKMMIKSMIEKIEKMREEKSMTDRIKEIKNKGYNIKELSEPSFSYGKEKIDE